MNKEVYKSMGKLAAQDTSAGKSAVENNGDKPFSNVLEIAEKFNQPVTVEGKLHQTALFVTDPFTGTILGAARDPEWILTDIDGYKPIVGGEHTAGHVEYNLGREFGKEKAAQVATDILDDIKEGKTPRYGALSMGVEREAWKHDKKTGELTPAPLDEQIELQQALWESPLNPPSKTPQELLLHVATSIIEQKEKHPDALIVETSVPYTGSIKDKAMGIAQGKYHKYVTLTSEKLLGYMKSPDPLGNQVANAVAKNEGYKDFAQMRDEFPHIGYWTCAAAHEAVGMPHIEQQASNGKKENHVPLEISIATSDMFNSDFATLAELLMYSSPIILGDAPKVARDGKEFWPKDYRALYRHIMVTTYPSEFIKDPETLYKRWKDLMSSKKVATLERASYESEFADGTTMPPIHGRVRHRPFGKSQDANVGRVEYVGCGSSPSLLDHAARDNFLRLLSISALEAVANGQHPSEYFKEKYPHMATWHKQDELAKAYNLHGTQDESVQALLAESMRYFSDMEQKYPLLAKDIAIAKSRVENMSKKAVKNLQEYRENPNGPFSEVIKNMIMDGMSTLEIAKEVNAYHIDTAKEIVANSGDVTQLLFKNKKAERKRSAGNLQINLEYVSIQM